MMMSHLQENDDTNSSDSCSSLIDGYHRPLDLSMAKRFLDDEDEDHLIEGSLDSDDDDNLEFIQALRPQITTSDPDESEDEIDLEQEMMDRREAIRRLGKLTEDLTCGFLDQIDEELDELSNAVSQFWNTESDHLVTSTTRYLIYLYDCDVSSREGKLWSEKPLTMKEKLASGETNIYHLTLAEIKGKLLEDSSMKRIWLNCRDTNVTLPEIEELFILFGQDSITHFSFGLPNVSFAIKIPADQFSDILCQYLPNLEYLEFNYTMNTTDKVCYSVPLKPKLLKLKTIKFNQPFSICWPLVHQVIKASPNLEKIYGFPFLHLKSLRSTKNPPPVKSFSYPSTGSHPLPGNQDNFQILGSLCRLRSNLEELCIFFQFRVLTRGRSMDLCKENLTRILINSQHTLRRLEIQPLESLDFLFQQKEFPRMHVLSTLRFNGDSPAPKGKSNMTKKAKMEMKNYNKFFPPGFNINEIFPNLSSVEIAVGIDDTDPNPIAAFEDFFPADIFRPCDTFMTIRHLKLTRTMPMVCLERLYCLFPNINVLSLEMNVGYLDRTLPLCLLLWPGLEQLILEIDVSIYPSQNLDSILIGLPREKCQQLRKIPMDEINIEEIEKNRTEPSVFKMKDLRLLRFIFDNAWGRVQSTEALFSHLLAHYFHTVPQLKVLIEFKNSCHRDGKEAILANLEPISQYVTVDG